MKHAQGAEEDGYGEDYDEGEEGEGDGGGEGGDADARSSQLGGSSLQQQSSQEPNRSYSSSGGAWQPDLMRLQHMRSAMMIQRAACLDLIGDKAFNEL